MINPIIIIVASAIFLSILVIYIFNKPKKPIMTGTLIILLVCFVMMTWFIDISISSFNSANSNQFADIVNFIIMIDNPTYIQLEDSFNLFMIIDIVLFALSFISLLLEAINILKKDRRR